jgi:uncharacterized protein YifE (UPF0438 family)
LPIQLGERGKEMMTFRDDKEFPYGFQNSGHFSFRETELLEGYGCLMAGLQYGELVPTTSKQKEFLEFLEGKREPRNDIERVWEKYQRIVQRPRHKMFHGKGGELAIDEDGNLITHATIVPRGSMTQRHK